MLVNREVLLAKIETTYNVDVAPTAADNAILAEALAWSNTGLKMNERPALRANIGTLKQLYGGSMMGLSITCEIKGSGSAGTAPEIGPLLRACGCSETIVGATSVTYKPASSGHESVTLYLYQDGTRLKLTGCKGNAEFSFSAGGKPMVTFNMVGHTYERGTAQSATGTTIVLATTHAATDDIYNGQRIKIIQGTGKGQERTITDYTGSTKTATVATWTVNPDSTSVYAIENGPADVAIASPTYDSTVPAPVIGLGFSVASYSAVIESLMLNLNNTLTHPGDVNSPDGYSSVYITKRDPGGSINPEHQLIATHDFIDKFRKGTAMALTTGAIGGTAGNILTVTMPAISYREAAPGDREGVRTMEMSYGAAESSGDDEVSLAFT
jgi:hypothetical protein